MAWNSQQPMNSIPQRNLGGPTGVTQVGATGGAAGAGGGPMMQQQGYMQQQQQGCCCQTDPNQQQQQGCFSCCDQTQQQQQQGCCQTDPNAPQEPMAMNLPLCVALFLFVSSVAGLGAIIGTYDREENLFSKLDATGSKASDLQARIYEQLGTAPTLDDEIRFHENALAALRKHVATPIPDTPLPDTPVPKVFNCDGFTCPNTYILKPTPDSIDCGGAAADCTRDKCCDKAYTCAKYECGDGLVSKPNKASIPCGASECEDTNCCLTEILCSTHTCGAAFIDKEDKDTESCGAATCTDAMCCDAKVFCDVHACGDLLDKDEKDAILCGTKASECSNSKCCDAKVFCDGFTCGALQDRDGKDTILCGAKASDCSASKCCVAETPSPPEPCPVCVTPTVVQCEPCVPCTPSPPVVDPNETDPGVVPYRAADVLAAQPGGGAPVPYACMDSVEVLGSGGSICLTTDANFMMLYIARAQTFRALLYFLVALFSAIWLFYYCFVRMYTSEVHGAPDQERAEELKGLMSVAHGAIAFWSFWFIVVEMYFYLKFNKFYRNNSGAELESFWRTFDDGFMTSVFLVAAVICWPMIAYVLEWILFAIFGCFGAMCAPGMQTYPQGGQAPGSMMRGGMGGMAGQEDCCAQMVKDWGNMPTSSIWQFLTRENGSSIAALQAGGARPAGGATGVVAVRPTLSNLDDDVEMQPSQQHLGGPGHHQQQQQPSSHLGAPPTQLMGVPVETPQQFGLNPQHARPQSSVLSQQQQNPVSQYPGAGASVAQGFPRPPSGQIAPTHADDEFTLKPRPSSEVRPVTAAAKVVKAAESDLEYSEAEPEAKKSSSRKDKRDKKEKHRRRKGDDSPSDRDDGKKEHKEKKEKKSRRSKDEDGEKRERRRRSHSKGADDEDGGEKRERRRRSHSKDKKDK